MTRTGIVAMCALGLAAVLLSAAVQGRQPEAVKTILFGRVTDEAGKPVVGVGVQLYSGIDTRWAGQKATTDADGKFRFDPLETGGTFEDRIVPGLRLTHDEMVSTDGPSWWDIDVPYGKAVERNFTMTRGGKIGGTLTFGMCDWKLREFDVRFVSADKKRTWYAKTDNRGSFTTESLFPGEYTVQANDGKMDYPVIATLTVEPGKTVTFRARCLFSMRAERLE